MVTTGICKHDNGETFAGQKTYQVSGICRKCGLNLDIQRLENWLRFLEERIQNLEGILNTGLVEVGVSKEANKVDQT